MNYVLRVIDHLDNEGIYIFSSYNDRSAVTEGKKIITELKKYGVKRFSIRTLEIGPIVDNLFTTTESLVIYDQLLDKILVDITDDQINNC